MKTCPVDDNKLDISKPCPVCNETNDFNNNEPVFVSNCVAFRPISIKSLISMIIENNNMTSKEIIDHINANIHYVLTGEKSSFDGFNQLCIGLGWENRISLDSEKHRVPNYMESVDDALKTIKKPWFLSFITQIPHHGWECEFVSLDENQYLINSGREDQYDGKFIPLTRNPSQAIIIATLKSILCDEGYYSEETPSDNHLLEKSV